MKNFTELLARIFLGQIFLIAGLGKIAAYAGTQGYMESKGVPGALLPLVIMLEVLGGLAIMVGWKTKFIALILAIFSVVAALIFHHDFSNQMEQILFMSDIAFSGGLLLLAVYGAGAYSLDSKRSLS